MNTMELPWSPQFINFVKKDGSVAYCIKQEKQTKVYHFTLEGEIKETNLGKEENEERQSEKIRASEQQMDFPSGKIGNFNAQSRNDNTENDKLDTSQNFAFILKND